MPYKNNNYLVNFLENNNLISKDKIKQLEKIENLAIINPSIAIIKFTELIKGEKLDRLSKQQLISSQKSFIKKSVYSDPKLIKSGLHIARIIFSHYAFFKNTNENNCSKLFYEDGIIKFYNYFNDQKHQQIKKAAAFFEIGPVHKIYNQNTIINNFNKNQPKELRNNTLKMKSDILKIIGRDTILNFRAKKLFDENTFFQRVNNIPDDNDHQKDTHSDVYFPALKFWYFPNKVDEGQGCLCIYPGSTKLTNELLNLHYKKSIEVVLMNTEKLDINDQEGSFRVSEKELKDIGLNHQEVAVPGNTLVIANVFGFHRRGHTKEKTVRDSIHGSIRVDNPFNTSIFR